MLVKIDKAADTTSLIVDYMLTIQTGQKTFIMYAPDLPTVKAFIKTFSIRQIRLSDRFDAVEKEALRTYFNMPL